jgi:hypothetical protein
MDEPQPRTDAAHLAANTLGRQLLEALIDEFKVTPNAWDKMTQAQQDQTIDRLRVKTRSLIGEALRVILQGQYPGCVATLERCNFSGGIKAMLTIDKHAHSRHELADAVGQQVIVVIGSLDSYTQQMDDLKAAAQQADLFADTGSRYTGEQDQPGYRSDVTPARPERTWADLTDLLASVDTLELEGGTSTPLWEQALHILSAVHVFPDREAASLWSEQECMVAFAWAKAMLTDPGTAGPRPWWLPQPTPPHVADTDRDAEGEKSTLFFGGADPAGDAPADLDTEETDDENEPN